MSFTGKENHDFTLAEAAEWTKRYRDANPGATKGHFFGKDAIQAVLNQSGCVGIRLYYALDEKNAKQLIMVGVKSDETDMYEGLIKERSIPCPPICGGENSLNK